MKPVVVYIFMGIILAGLAGIAILFHLENKSLHREIAGFKNITETLARSQVEIVSKKDLKEALKDILSKEDLKALNEDLRKQGAELKTVGKTVARLERRVRLNQKSDSQGKPKEKVVVCKEDGRPIDVHGYTQKSQKKTLKDKNEADLAEVVFDASTNMPWSYEVLEREFHLSTVVGKKKDGSDIYYHSLKYKVPGRHEGKLFNIPITSSNYKQQLSDREWFWFNPTLDITTSIGGVLYSIDVAPEDAWSLNVDLGVSISSYGRTKADNLLKLFRFGIGYDGVQNSALLSFSPISYNLGDPMPLLTNLYITPKISIDHKGNITLSAGFGLQL